MQKSRVVVTGMGAITPIGLTVEEFWENVKAQKVGIGAITKFDTTDFKVKLAAEVKDFDAQAYMDFKQAKRMELFSQYAVAAAGQANYAASKAGVIGLTKSAAKELASRQITVNAIAPGYIDTDMTAVLSDSVKESVQSSIPLKRMGTAQDIAQAAVFLASDKASYITGQVLSVNGGMV